MVFGSQRTYLLIFEWNCRSGPFYAVFSGNVHSGCVCA
jgi:hypothetical protein